MADLPLDFGTLEKYGCFVGSHAVVILSDKDDMKAVALNLMRFFEDESCGQCTPCRVGTEKAVKLMATGPWDESLLNELSAAMRDASICGLGQAAPNPLTCVFKYFPRRTDEAAGQLVTAKGKSDERGQWQSQVGTFTLDGGEVEAREGETIWQVAKRHGIDIPHLCYSPEPGYRADGNCRACMVEIEGERVLAASCIRTPTPG